MIANVFAPDAITTCERHGHAWKRQEPWKGSGVTHRECWRCGATTAGWNVVVAPDEEAQPAIETATPQPRRLRQVASHAERDATIARMRSEGVRVVEIAGHVAMSVGQVYAILARLGGGSQ